MGGCFISFPSVVWALLNLATNCIPPRNFQNNCCLILWAQLSVSSETGLVESNYSSNLEAEFSALSAAHYNPTVLCNALGNYSVQQIPFL